LSNRKSLDKKRELVKLKIDLFIFQKERRGE